MKAVAVSPLIVLSLCLKASAQTIFVNLSETPVYVTQERFVPINDYPYYNSDQYCYSGWWTIDPLGGTLSVDSAQAYYVEHYIDDGDDDPILKPIIWSRTEHVGPGLIHRDVGFEDVCLSTENFRNELRDAVRQHPDVREVEYHGFGNTLYPIGDALRIESQVCHFDFSSHVPMRHYDSCSTPGKIIDYERTTLNAFRVSDVSTEVIDDETTFELSVNTDAALADGLNELTPSYYQASFEVYYVVP